MNQDPINRHRENGLVALFSKFTLNFYISVLTDCVNTEKIMKYELMNILNNSTDCNENSR